MNIALIGHWSAHPHISGGDEQTRPSTPQALADLARGLSAGGHAVEVLPFGSGADCARALEAVSSPYVPVIHGADETGSRALGERLLQILGSSQAPRIIVEGGHSAFPDAGFGFLEALTGIHLPFDASSVARLPEAIAAARKIVASAQIRVAASTARPLIGPTSPLLIGPDLLPRNDVDPALVRDLGRLRLPTAALPLADTQPPDFFRLPGSGAAGGAAGILAACGARLAPTGDILATLTDLSDRIAASDLVVIAEPEMHSSSLAEAHVDTIAQLAADYALPVVVAAIESSLSRHEWAQWGIHGVVTAGENCEERGHRIARTWARP
ncbi:MAG: glycerate kinase [Actinomycetaceae bacterium]|nr:glycerate kinase [Actinomycetaceae bacterium]